MSREIKSALEEFLPPLLQKHHLLYRLPAVAEGLEELIASALKNAGVENDWKPDRSHAVSVDMTCIKTAVSISVKSGTYSPIKSELTISGSRLGQHGDLEAMLDAVERERADIYVCLAKDKGDWAEVPERFQSKIYYLFVFQSNVLDYRSGDWEVSVSAQGKKKFFMETKNLSASITESMSHQLWTKAKEELVGHPLKVVI